MIEDEHKTDFTASVGVNLTHDLSIGSAMAESALPDEGGNGGTGFGDLNCPPRLAAFSVYYDDTTKSLKMVDPQIVVCGKEVKCEALAEVEDGIYYCNVRRNTSSNEYEAKIEPVMAIDSAESKAVCSVKLFKLDGEDFTQYHAGVIALYDIGAKLTLQNKEESGSIALDASGDSPKLVIEKDGKSISLDPSALDDGESIAVQTITVKGDFGEDKEVKILASEEFAPDGAGVTSANGATGDVNVIGGKGIEVSTDGQTIKVTWNEDKEDEDEDPNDDGGDEPSNTCDHDSEGGSEGGVAAGGGGGGGVGGGGASDDEGGVPAGGGESHTGDDNCNCG